MNQKNSFMVFGVVLLLQGIIFYVMGDKVVSSSFPDLAEDGKSACVTLLSVMAMLSIALGLISIAARNTPDVLWAYTVGVGLLTLNTLKHYFIDHINVPIPAMIIQVGITLVCGYLWMQKSKTAAS